jgi:hypothetical protein
VDGATLGGVTLSYDAAAGPTNFLVGTEQVRIYTCMCVCMYVYIYIHMYVPVYIYSYIYVIYLFV